MMTVDDVNSRVRDSGRKKCWEIKIDSINLDTTRTQSHFVFLIYSLKKCDSKETIVEEQIPLEIEVVLSVV